MAKYSFSYHDITEGVDFYDSNFYNDKQINAIKDPEGGNSQKLPTSIPSPFAVMDLVTTAFEKLADTDYLVGHKIYEKIVSQCWDIGILFFNAKGLDKRIEIIKWDRAEQIEELVNSSSNGHKILGETLRMFLKDDAIAYNFDEMSSVYMIKYNHNILGGTSPKTLFYCSLNPFEDDKENHINLGNNDVLFDKDYCPLYDRPEDFQLFIYSFIKHYDLNASKSGRDTFSVICAELYSYLEKNKAILKSKNRSLYDQIVMIKGEDYQDYLSINAGKEGSYISVLGEALRGKSPKTDGKSDFKIKSTKFEGKVPLVLFPNFGGENLFGETMVYFDNLYSNDIDENIPFYHNEIDINKREIPGMTGIEYPFLLVDDLLEDTLLKVGNELNSEDFFTSNYINEDQGFLCPIKKEFFKYFDTEDILKNKTEGGEPLFQLEERSGGSIVATLRIPVNRGFIPISKTYLKQGDGKIDRDKNIGVIIAFEADINIYPFIKYDPKLEQGYTDGELTEYRTHWIYHGISELPKTIYFKNNLEVVANKESSLKGNIMAYGYQVHLSESYYDFIEVEVNNKKAMIIPLWVQRINPSSNFHFAIDFGTTNTHIEYRKGEHGIDKPLSINEKVFGRLSKSVRRLKDNANNEFIPDKIDENIDFRFHQRTAIAVTNSLDYRKPTITLGDLRIPFYFESNSHTNQSTSQYHTNLKWSQFVNGAEDETRVKAFLEQLAIMMKVKVLADGGIIKNTKFTWFFPSSMVRARIAKLEKVWLEILQKHFHIPYGNIKKISESIAPFAYYMENERLDSLQFPAVTVDIGGGTSDMVVFKDDIPLYISSFRYAANSIFGDGYNSKPSNNAFLLKYFERIRDLLSANELSNLLGALNSIKDKNASSSDIIAFFMSLENNVEIRRNEHKISFQKELANDADLKVVLLLFYHALVFHMAMLLKNKGLDIPGVIVFSGNGGNLIRIIDDSHEFELLSDYTTLVFEEVFDIELNRKIDLKLNDNPKAVTSKGGLYYKESLNVKIKDINTVLVGVENEPVKLPTYEELKSNQALHKNDVTLSVIKCISMFFDINSKFNFNDNFSIDAGVLKTAEGYLKREGTVHKWLLKGLNIKMEEVGDKGNIDIEETLFFYPFIGLLNELAFTIYKSRR